MRHTNKFVTENFATLCNPRGKGSSDDGPPKKPQRPESRNQRVYLIKKLFSAAAANTRQRDEDGSNRQKAKRILFENNFNRSCTDNIFELFY